MKFLAPLLVLALGLLSCTATKVRTTHYLASFDPEDQVPPELYKIQIRGDASAFSNVKYGSGWVPASQADLLEVDVRQNDQGRVEITGNSAKGVSVTARRRFFEIGPAGVSTQPQDGRFVVVMSANPDYFFQKLGMLTRFGKDDSAVDASKTALLGIVGEKQVATAKALAATKQELLDLSKPAPAGGGSQ